jgi:anion-transporting  ArsA/GET3 family ATPase
MAPPRLWFVTGKGGTGKSTVSAALALALSRRRPTTLAGLDRRQAAAAMLGLAADGAPAKDSDESLQAVALSARAELESFIERIVPVRAISRRMLRSRTFGYVTAALPGLEAFLLLERLRIMAGDAALMDRYLVVDAPSSGSALELLSVAAGVTGIAPVGTLNRLADEVARFLRDPQRFGALLTTSPEELALAETLETAAALSRLGIAAVAAVVNRAPDPLFDTPELAALSALEDHARLAIRRRAAHEFAALARKRLRDASLAALELPMLYSEVMGPREIARLGRTLASRLVP